MLFAKRKIASLMLAVPMAMAVQAQEAPSPLAAGQDKFLGSVYSPTQLEGFEQYFNQVTAENAGKWGVVTNQASRPMEYSDEWFTAQGGNSWAGGLDESVQFAEDNGFPYRMHVMVWGNQQPSWIRNLSEAEQLEAIVEWFDVVSTRYSNEDGTSRFDYVEVVNEPVNDPPDQPDSDNQGGNYIEALGGAGETGYDWLVKSFELGREYFPNETLMLNEYNVLSVGSVRSTYIDMIEVLHERNLIDAVGIQAHAFSTTGSAADIKSALDEVAAIGLPIQITEMDVDGLNDTTQLNSFRKIFPIFWEHPSVEGVTLWGFRPGMWREEQGAVLVEEDGTERRAMTWLKCYMGSQGSGNPAVLSGQEFTGSSDMMPGDSIGQLMDCYGETSTTVDSWSVVGGTGENQFTISNTGQIMLAEGQSLVDGESLTLDVVANAGAVSSEPVTVDIQVSGTFVRPPSAELPSGGSSGSINLWLLGLLGLMGGARVLRRR